NDWKDLKQVTHELDTFYNFKYPHDITTGKIIYSDPDIEGLEESYQSLIAKRFEWLIKHCSTNITRDANKRVCRSERMKVNRSNGQKKKAPAKT
ncbi:MAG: hypothetical protein JSW41_01930, partial [Candidatus Aenigmatarchaeota archaeon]